MTQDTSPCPSQAFHIIGITHSCYKEKFGTPRQPGLVTEAKACVELYPPYNRPEAVDGLTQSSHIWLHFIFHKTITTQWKPTVRPPRLGGNKRMGVFATRSPSRPNALGLSVVKLDSIDTSNGVSLHISGVDLVDGTPIVDIKPYIPYADSIPEATNTFADAIPPQLHVTFEENIEKFIQSYSHNFSTNLKNLIEQILQQDPRPAYQLLDTERTYGMALLDLEIKWRYVQEEKQVYIRVIDVMYS